MSFRFVGSNSFDRHARAYIFIECKKSVSPSDRNGRDALESMQGTTDWRRPCVLKRNINSTLVGRWKVLYGIKIASEVYVYFLKEQLTVVQIETFVYLRYERLPDRKSNKNLRTDVCPNGQHTERTLI